MRDQPSARDDTPTPRGTIRKQTPAPSQPGARPPGKSLPGALGCAILLAALQLAWVPAQCAPLDIELGAGTLGPGRFGLFSFSIAEPVRGTDSLVLSSAGSGFDTEIAVYDANGRLVAANDDAGPGNKTSRLTFGSARELAAGAYTAVISGFNSIFRQGDIVPGSHPGGHFRLGLQSTRPVSTAPLPAHQAADGNLLDAAIREIELGSGWLAAGAIQRLDFTLERDIGGGDWLAIHTAGSGIDTEIGLYDARGALVATNDDADSRTRTSRLAFGLDGDNGRALAAGQYTVLLGSFNTVFASGVRAVSRSTEPGKYSVHLQQTVGTPSDDPFLADPTAIDEPSPLTFFGLAAAAAIATRRRRLQSACIGNEMIVSAMKRKPAYLKQDRILYSYGTDT
jgi:MYXO-CTERM domain-containing protein